MNKSIHRCPYDDNREPSLVINWPEKTFQCMNCGVHGDVGEIEQILLPKKEGVVEPEFSELRTCDRCKWWGDPIANGWDQRPCFKWRDGNGPDTGSFVSWCFSKFGCIHWEEKP